MSFFAGEAEGCMSEWPCVRYWEQWTVAEDLTALQLHHREGAATNDRAACSSSSQCSGWTSLDVLEETKFNLAKTTKNNEISIFLCVWFGAGAWLHFHRLLSVRFFWADGLRVGSARTNLAVMIIKRTLGSLHCFHKTLRSSSSLTNSHFQFVHISLWSNGPLLWFPWCEVSGLHQ